MDIGAEELALGNQLVAGRLIDHAVGNQPADHFGQRQAVFRYDLRVHPSSLR